MFLGQFFVKDAKNDPRTHFERPKSGNFEKRKNAEIAGNRVKKGHFRPFKRQNSDVFQDIYFKFCTRIHLTGLFQICSVLLIIRKFSVFFGKSFFC